MIKIIKVRIGSLEECIQKNEISKDNIISANPIIDEYGGLVTVIVYEDGVSERTCLKKI